MPTKRPVTRPTFGKEPVKRPAGPDFKGTVNNFINQNRQPDFQGAVGAILAQHPSTNVYGPHPDVDGLMGGFNKRNR